MWAGASPTSEGPGEPAATYLPSLVREKHRLYKIVDSTAPKRKTEPRRLPSRLPSPKAKLFNA